MKYFVKIKDSIHMVDVEDKEGFQVILWDGKPVQVDCTKNKNHSVNAVLIDGRPYETDWIEREGRYCIRLHQKEFEVTVQRGALSGKGFTGNKEGSCEEVIYAPMPGLVAAVKVQPDQDVRMGDPLLILEAMKMENELRCPVDGKIRKVLVKMGKKVEKGEELVVISK